MVQGAKLPSTLKLSDRKCHTSANNGMSNVMGVQIRAQGKLSDKSPSPLVPDISVGNPSRSDLMI